MAPLAVAHRHNTSTRLYRALGILNAHRAEVFAYARTHNLFESCAYVRAQWGAVIGRTSLGTWLREQPDYDHAAALRLKRSTTGAIGGATHFGHEGRPDEVITPGYTPRWPVRTAFSPEELARIRETLMAKLVARRPSVAEDARVSGGWRASQCR